MSQVAQLTERLEEANSLLEFELKFRTGRIKDFKAICRTRIVVKLRALWLLNVRGPVHEHV